MPAVLGLPRLQVNKEVEMKRWWLVLVFLVAPGCVSCIVSPAMKETAKVWADAYEETKCNAQGISGEDKARCLHFNDNGRKLFEIEESTTAP